MGPDLLPRGVSFRRSTSSREDSPESAKPFKEATVQVLASGQQIKHHQYGLGIVTESDAERTAIDFNDHGRKLFVTSLMTAELIGDAPVNPVRAKRRSRKSARRN
jgi:hypothetical protein